MKAKLLKRIKYPAAWAFNFVPLEAGAIVPVIEARNLPRLAKGKRYWVNTPDLADDCYGILLEPGDYELVR